MTELDVLRGLDERFLASSVEDDPVKWAKDTLGVDLWSKQREILRLLERVPRVAVPSTHGVGKSFLASVATARFLTRFPPATARVVTCFTDDTEILTRDGWKLFQDVKVGPDGDLFATRNQETKNFEWQHATRYYQAPWDGEVVDVRGRCVDVRVTPNHRMLTHWSEYKNGKRVTGEILKPAEKITQRGADIPVTSNWNADPVLPVKFGRYEWDSVTFASFLGAWLAEGSLGPRRTYEKRSGDTSVYGGAIALTQSSKSKGYEPYRELLTKMIGAEPTRSQDKDWVFHCRELYEFLSPLGKAGDKYIPTEIKNWGRAELEALLHHYLLGDGWRTGSSWSSCTVSRRLAGDLQEIAQKIGQSATMVVREPRDGGTFAGGRKILAENCRPGYYLRFSESKRRSVKVSRSHYTGNVYCVSVPNEVIYIRRGHRGSPIWCGNTAPSFDQVKNVLWNEINQRHVQSNGKLPGRVNQTEWWIGSYLAAFGRKPSDYAAATFQGIHAQHILIILDEADAIPADLWTQVEVLATNAGAKILAIGNPVDPQSVFAKHIHGAEIPGSDGNPNKWHVVRVPAWETPLLTGEPVGATLRESLITPEFVEDKRKEWGEDSPLWKARIAGVHPTESEMTVVRLADVEASKRGFDGEEPTEPTRRLRFEDVQLGVDIAASARGDETVIYERCGTKIGRRWAVRTDDPDAISDLIVLAQRQSRATLLHIDATGVGFGFLSDIKRRIPGVAIAPFYAAQSAEDPKQFINRRAEAHWYLRERLRHKTIDFSQMEGADDTTNQLCSIRYAIAKGKIQVEPKDDVRKRIGRSPDDSDALLLAVLPPSGTGLPAPATARAASRPRPEQSVPPEGADAAPVAVPGPRPVLPREVAASPYGVRSRRRSFSLRARP